MATATPSLLRRINTQLVLDALRDASPMRVAELVDRTRLSRPTVDAAADELLRLGWVAEVGDEVATSPRRGRPARLLSFRADAGYVVGVDIGAAKVRVAVADLRGESIAERTRHYDSDDRLSIIRHAIADTLKEAGVRRKEVLSACVGCTGGMDPAAGKVLFSSVFPEGFDLRRALTRTLGPRVVIENDCNLAAIGEAWRGVARGVEDAICVLAGERMGAGILVGGRLVRGHAGAAGEMAFLGAYEEHHGAEGIAYLARLLGQKAAARGQAGTLLAAAGGDAGRIDADTVFAAARAGDPAALRIAERSARAAGRAIVTMALVLNPELVVIGGGVARAGDVVLEPLRRQLERMARLPPRLEASPLAERVVLVGAIRHALDTLEPRLLDGLPDAA